ncbi:MAG: hypothetical protein J0I08_07615 [Rhizobiales bacterium]|nr:hypothetical protein [Hyphomicrobiales bacterium]
MSTTNEGCTVKDLAKLAQMTVEQMQVVLRDHTSPSTISPLKRRFTYAVALEIEVARQLSDNSGVPISEALRLGVYTMAVQGYVNGASANTSGDFWMAVVASRNTWGKEPRGSWPVTGFGPKEYWAELHFSGSLGAIAGEISEWIGRDQINHPDSDPARIVMANVSAADRRLRKRATELGIKVVGNEFA